MITPILEKLILQQKAKYYRVTIGDSPLSVLQVPVGHTIVITELEVFANMQIPAANNNPSAPVTFNDFIGLMVNKLQNTPTADINFDTWFTQNQMYLKGMITQLVEQSLTTNNTYTINPKQQTNWLPVENGYYYDGTACVYQYPSFISEKSNYDVLNVHTNNITFRWCYPFMIDSGNYTAPVTNIIRTGLLDYSGSNPVFSKQFTEPGLPQGLKQGSVRATGSIEYPDSQIGLWLPSGKFSLDRDWVNNRYPGQYDLIRYPNAADQGSSNDNSGAHTVDYNIANSGTVEIDIQDCIFTYLMRPRANVGYVVINENTHF